MLLFLDNSIYNERINGSASMKLWQNYFDNVKLQPLLEEIYTESFQYKDVFITVSYC